MAINLKPQSTLGKWATGLIIGFFFCLVLLIVLVMAGQRGGDTFLEFSPLVIPGILAAVCGIASFVSGLVAIIKSQERSVLVFMSTAIGCAITVFIIGEFLVPH
jgi:LytS/YehU family sensor histidine kinase